VSSSHIVPVECGRFLSIDRSERLCELCNSNEIGDEFHYMFNCEYFNNEKTKLSPEEISKDRNVSFANLFSTTIIF
jgi:hypothetical protein